MKNSTGTAKSFSGDRVIKFGTIGSADITGISLGGFRTEIECKTGNAKQSDQQKRFQTMIEKFGGIYILSKAENKDDITRAVEATIDQLQKILRLRGIKIPERVSSPIEYEPIF